MSQRSRPRNEHAIRRPETKSFILTSEFWVAAGAAAAVFLGGYVLNDITNTTAWRYGTWIAIAYIISRGIAKAGSQRAYQPEPSSGRGDAYWRDNDDGDRRSQRDELDLRDNPSATTRRSDPSPVGSQDGEPTQAYDPTGR